MNSRPDHRKNKFNQRDRDEPISTSYEKDNPSWQSNSTVGTRRRVYDGKATYTWKYKNKTGGLQLSDLKDETIKGFKGNFNRNQDPLKNKVKIKSIYASEGATQRNDWVRYVKAAQNAWFEYHQEMKTYPCVLSDPIVQLMYHALKRNIDDTVIRKKPVSPSVYPFIKWKDMEQQFKDANQLISMREISSSDPEINQFNPFDQKEDETNFFLLNLIQEKNLWMGDNPGKLVNSDSWQASSKMLSKKLAPSSFREGFYNLPQNETDNRPSSPDVGFDLPLDLPEPEVRSRIVTELATSPPLLISNLNTQNKENQPAKVNNEKPMRYKPKIQFNDPQILSSLRNKSFDTLRPLYYEALATVINSPDNFRLLYDRTLWVRKKRSSQKRSLFHETSVASFKKLSSPKSWISSDNIEDFCMYYNHYSKRFDQYFIHPQQYIKLIEREEISNRQDLKNYRKWIILPRREVGNDHWFVITVEFFPVSGVTSEKTEIHYKIDVYDSLQSDRNNQREKIIQKIKNFIEKSFSYIYENTNINFPIIQQDGFSCGIFTLLTILFLFHNQDPMLPENRIQFSADEIEKLREVFSGFLATNVQIMPPTENDTDDIVQIVEPSKEAPLQLTGVETSKRLMTTLEMKIRGNETLKRMRRATLLDFPSPKNIPTTVTPPPPKSVKRKRNIQKNATEDQVPRRSTRTRKENQLKSDYSDLGKKR
jgi:hypothetical protein